MNNRGTIKVPSCLFSYNLVLAAIIGVIIISIFTDFIPFLSKQPLLARIAMLAAVLVLSGDMLRMLMAIGVYRRKH